ncbi:hypothetical protein [Cytobacillus pseudoceanisediminis]|uniref:hypothetical protein n=1 Tax=Cytobacillus pseudoceanisediminis TaxID=3051614 RepID=UPI003CED5CD7
MKKNLFVVVLGLVIMTATILAGCEESMIRYEGELRPESEVEEIIADKLEVENPELDLEVNITEEVED